MKIELTETNEKLLHGRYPCLAKAAKVIEHELGVSLEMLRSDTRIPMIVEARVLFWALCQDKVYPSYCIASYLCRTHATGIFYKKFFLDRCDIDDSFVELYNKLVSEYNKIE